jgi:hypothetical protein
MASKKPYETKTASISASISFEQIHTLSGTYKGQHTDNVIQVDSTQNAQFDKVFEGLLEIIRKIGKIPDFVLLQSPNGHTMVKVRLVLDDTKDASSPFRPRRKKLSKSGKKVGKKSGKKSSKVRKNKRKTTL